MNIETLFKDLAVSELSNSTFSNAGVIKLDRRETVVLHANEGLLRLHTRFLLKTKDVIIEMRDGITNYHFLNRYTLSRYVPPENDEDCTPYECLPYIIDMGREQFNEDVIKVLEVWDSTNRRLPLNDPDNSNSLFTPQPNILQVPSPKLWNSLSVMYQANHEILSLEEGGHTKITLPPVLVPALRSYIAYKVYSNMNTQEAVASASNFLGAFNQLCDEVTEGDLVNSSSSSTNTRFNKNGWV